MSVLDDALDFYLRTNAQRGVARVEAALRTLGVRRRRAGRARRRSVGWESLTDSELGVARLAAEGLTNREVGARLFISDKTVSVHLSNVMAKLGASSRTEAVTRALRDGVLPG